MEEPTFCFELYIHFFHLGKILEPQEKKQKGGEGRAAPPACVYRAPSVGGVRPQTSALAPPAFLKRFSSLPVVSSLEGSQRSANFQLLWKNERPSRRGLKSLGEVQHMVAALAGPTRTPPFI